MQTVRRYALALKSGPQILPLPAFSLILHAGVLNYDAYLWVKIDVEEKTMRDRCFYVIESDTNLPVKDGHLLGHLATVIDTPFVWHIFEEFKI